MKRNQDHRVVAVYQGATLSAYRGNPLIEALPPINSFLDDSSALKGSLRCTAEDTQPSKSSTIGTILSLGRLAERINCQRLIPEPVFDFAITAMTSRRA